jgi:Tetratricopeptide repeat
MNTQRIFWLALAGLAVLLAGSDAVAQGKKDSDRKRRNRNQPTTRPRPRTTTQPSKKPDTRPRRTTTRRSGNDSQPKPRRRPATGSPNSGSKRRTTRPDSSRPKPPTRTKPRTDTRKPRRTTRPDSSRQKPPTRTKPRTDTRKPRRTTIPKTGTRKKPRTGTLPGIGTKRGKRTTIGKTKTAGTRRKRTGSVGTLPGITPRRRTGRTGGTLPSIDSFISGQRHRISRQTSAKVRAELARRRSRELARQLQISRNRQTRQTITTRRVRDWQLWQRDNYRRYSWVRGRWGGSWTSRWDRYWERRWRRRYPAVLIVGATLWGMNRIGYQFGYQDYYNPYAGDPIVVGDTTIDYSQPLCQPIADGPQEQEATSFALARKAFMEGNYPLALSDVNAALKDSPQDAMMHEFRALVLFAMGEYKQAAAPLNAVVAVGPGLDWKSLRGLYPDAATYTKQYRALEKFVTDNPKDAAGHFVLGYHYVTLGFNSYALKEFQQAAELSPKDAVARQMVAMLSKGESKDDPNEADQEKPIETAAGAKTSISLEQFTGTWTAKRDKATFTLVMTQDDHFTWTHVAADGRKSEIKGVYAIKDGALALEPDSGGVMLANVSFKGDREMNFRMVSDDDKDPGLSFSKS